MIDYCDVVIGLQYGDEGKGKVAAALCTRDNYDWTARYNGGPNAGHTVTKTYNGEEIRYHVHSLPSGILNGVPSYIGPGCVVNVEALISEIEEIESAIPEKSFFSENLQDLLWIDPRCPVIQWEHIELDAEGIYKTQGSTKRGIAPAYSEFYGREAELIKVFQNGTSSLHRLPIKYFIRKPALSGRLLAESAQGMWLDIIQGNYPYTTSSHVLPHFACSLGFSHRKIRHVIGVAKCYETRSGTDPFFVCNMRESGELKAPGTAFEEACRDDYMSLAKLGDEKGVTTGRDRQVKWLDLTALAKAIELTGCNYLIMNKCDIYETHGKYNLFIDGDIHDLATFGEWKEMVEKYLLGKLRFYPTILYSGSMTDDFSNELHL